MSAQDAGPPAGPSATQAFANTPLDFSYKASGYRGVDIELKTLEKYVAALSNPEPAKPATEYLAEKLYLFQEPHALPKAIQSYYAGPREKGYEPVDLDAQYKPPSPTGKFANVGSRTSHSHGIPPPPPELHTSLEYGLTSVDPLLPDTARSRSARRGTGRTSQSARRNNPLSQSTPGFSFAPAGTTSRLQHSFSRVGDGVAEGADAAAAEGSEAGSATPSLTRSITRLRATQKEAAANAKEKTPTEKFVGEIEKMMGRVRAGQALIEKIAAASAAPGTGPAALPHSITQPLPAPPPVATSGGTNAARSTRRGVAAASAAAADQRPVQVYTRVKVPAAPQQMLMAREKANGKQLLAGILEKEGYSRTDMRKILDQLLAFQGFEEELLQAVADKFVLYNYPPNSLLYARGTVCEEVHVVLSGHCLLQPEGGRAVRLQPGTVLGVDMMLRRARANVDVRTDPHFEAHVACLAWGEYREVLCSWAAGRVLQLVPGLQFSVETRLRNAVAKNGVYVQREAGEAVYSEGDASENVMLLVKGQVLLTQRISDDVIQTEGQLVNQLRLTMGDTKAIVPTEIPRTHRAGGKGDSEAGSTFESAILRRRAAAAAKQQTCDTGLGFTAPPPAPSDGLGPRSSDGGMPAVPSLGGSGTSSLSGAPPTTAAGAAAAGLASWDGKPTTSSGGGAEPTPGVGVHEGLARSSQVSQESSYASGSSHPNHSPALVITCGSDAGNGGGGDVAVELATLVCPHASSEGGEGFSEPEPLTPIQGLVITSEPSMMPDGGLPDVADSQPGSQSSPGPPGVRVSGAGEGGARPASARSAFEFGGDGEGGEDVRHVPRTPFLAAPLDSHMAAVGDEEEDVAGQPPASPDVIPVLQPVVPEGWGMQEAGTAHPAGTAQQLTLPDGSRPSTSNTSDHYRSGAQSPFPDADAPAALQGGSSHAGSVGGAGGNPQMMAGAGEAPAAEDDAHMSTSAPTSEHSGDVGGDAARAINAVPAARLSIGSKISGHPDPRQGHPLVPHRLSNQSSKQPSLAGSGRPSPQASFAGSDVGGLKDGAATASNAGSFKGAGGASVAGSTGGAAATGSTGGAAAPAGSTGGSPKGGVTPSGGRGTPTPSQLPPRPGQSEQGGADGAGAAHVPPVKGVPMHNALAQVIKSNKQRVAAVYSLPCFLGEEGVQGDPSAIIPRGHTAVTMAATQYILIPRAVLLASLPAFSADGVRKRMQSQQHKVLLTGAPAKKGQTRWPEAADTLREYLHTAPGARPSWQVEALADGFSALPAFAKIPWQARLRLFQELQLREIPVGGTPLPLARIITTVSTGASMGGMSAMGPESSIPVDLYDALQSRNTVLDEEEAGSERSGAPRGSHKGSRPPSGLGLGQEPSGASWVGGQGGWWDTGAFDSNQGPLDAQDRSLQGSVVQRSNAGSVQERGPSGLVGESSDTQLADALLKAHSSTPPKQLGGSVAGGSVPGSVPGSFKGSSRQGSVRRGGGGSPVEGEENAGVEGQGRDEVADSPSEGIQAGTDAYGDGFGFTVEQRGSTHEVVPKQVAGLPIEIRTGTPGSVGTMGTLGAWEGGSVGPELSGMRTPDAPGTAREDGGGEEDEAGHRPVPAGYEGYVLHPHSRHIPAHADEEEQSRGVTPRTEDEEREGEEAGALTTRSAATQEQATPRSDGTVSLAPAAPPLPVQVHTISLKSEDSIFIVISGSVLLQAVLQPGPEAGPPSLASNSHHLSQSASEHMNGPAGGSSEPDPFAPTTLQAVEMGASFTSAGALSLAELWPPGAPSPCSTPRQAADLAPKLPGTRVISVVPGPATSGSGSGSEGDQRGMVEMLCMSYPLFGLTVGGGGRVASIPEAGRLLSKLEWAAPLWNECVPGAMHRHRMSSEGGGSAKDIRPGEGKQQVGPEDVAWVLAGKVRVEEHKAGVELLRRGEAAGSLYLVSSGSAVLRAGHVGLQDADGPAAAFTVDLLTLKEGEGVGELSLLANRPLWYSLVTASPSVTLLSIDIQALRDYVTSCLTPTGVAKLLRAVADVDRQLYATAVHAQALAVSGGNMELEAFSPPMRALIKQVLDLGNLDMSDVRGAARDALEASRANTHTPPTKDGKADQAGPVIIENANMVNQVVSSLARPNPYGTNANDVAAMAQWGTALAAKNELLDGFHAGGRVMGVPSMSLADTLTATLGLHPSAQRKDEGSQVPLGNTTLRVAVPSLVQDAVPGSDALARPAPMRPARQFDRRHVPGALQGHELERGRDPREEVLPNSVLTASEVLSLIRVRVHLKPSALVPGGTAAALGLTAPAHHAHAVSGSLPVSGNGQSWTGRPGSARTGCDQPHMSSGQAFGALHHEARRESPTRGTGLRDGAGAASFSYGTHLNGGGGLPLRSLRASASLAPRKAGGSGLLAGPGTGAGAGVVLPDEGSVALGGTWFANVNTPVADAQGLGGSSTGSVTNSPRRGVASLPGVKMRAGVMMMRSSATFRHRHLQRNLTDALWDDSHTALQELIQRTDQERPAVQEGDEDEGEEGESGEDEEGGGSQEEGEFNVEMSAAAQQAGDPDAAATGGLRAGEEEEEEEEELLEPPLEDRHTPVRVQAHLVGIATTHSLSMDTPADAVAAAAAVAAVAATAGPSGGHQVDATVDEMDACDQASASVAEPSFGAAQVCGASVSVAAEASRSTSASPLPAPPPATTASEPAMQFPSLPDPTQPISALPTALSSPMPPRRVSIATTAMFERAAPAAPVPAPPHAQPSVPGRLASTSVAWAGASQGGPLVASASEVMVGGDPSTTGTIGVPEYILRALEEQDEAEEAARHAHPGHGPGGHRKPHAKPRAVSAHSMVHTSTAQGPASPGARSPSPGPSPSPPLQGSSLLPHSSDDAGGVNRPHGVPALHLPAHRPTTASTTSVGWAKGTDLGQRTFWVRDAAGVHDPSGITNPMVAELMTAAVREVVPSQAAQVQVRLPAPMGALPEPRLRDLPGSEALDEADARVRALADAAASAVRSKVAAANAAQERQKRGSYISHPAAVATAVLATVAMQAGATATQQSVMAKTGDSVGSAGPGSPPRASGLITAAYLSDTSTGVDGAAASAAVARRRALLGGAPANKLVTASAVALSKMPPVSQSLALRQRIRMKQAQLGRGVGGHGRPGSSGQEVGSGTGGGAEGEERPGTLTANPSVDADDEDHPIRYGRAFSVFGNAPLEELATARSGMATFGPNPSGYIGANPSLHNLGAAGEPSLGGFSLGGFSTASMQQGGAPGALSSSGAAAKPGPRVMVDGAALHAQDLAFITMEVPPRVKIHEELDLSKLRPPAPPPPPSLPVAPPQGAHMARVMAGITQGSNSPRYTPPFLRHKRESVMPQLKATFVGEEDKQWVVPAFNSQQGFEYGVYDESAQIVYFD